MIYRPTVITPPVEYPVSLTEAKIQLRIDSDEENSLIERLIGTATEWAQTYTARQFVTATLEDRFDYFGSQLCLRRSPVQSISSIIYVDDDGAEQTLAGDQYKLVLGSIPPAVETTYNVSWPSVRGESEAVRVRYVAGYGDAADVPEVIRGAILMKLTALFDRRDAMSEGDHDDERARALLWGERVMVA